MRRTPVVVAALFLLVVLAPRAYAAWTASGTGSGAAKAITLATPSGVSLLCTSGQLPSVSWTAVPGASSYTVTRTFLNLGTSTVGTTSATSLSDTTGGLLNLLVTYSVTAKVGNWSSSAGTVSIVLSVNIFSGKCS